MSTTPRGRCPEGAKHCAASALALGECERARLLENAERCPDQRDEAEQCPENRNRDGTRVETGRPVDVPDTDQHDRQSPAERFGVCLDEHAPPVESRRFEGFLETREARP